MNFFMEVAKLRAGRLLWSELVAQFDPKNAEIAVAAHAFADLRLVADRAGPVQQRRPHLHRGDGRHPGPHPVAAHQRARRGAGAAHRLLRPHRPQHPAAAAAGVRHHPADRPVGRLVLRGVADPSARRAGPRPHRRGGRARRHGAGDRRRHPEAAHRGGGRAHPGPHRLRSAAGDRRQQVPGRRGPRDRGAQGREQPGARRADRQAAAAARRPRPGGGRRRAGRTDPGRGRGGGETAGNNLLALAIDAARAKATVGEISDALEKV